MTSGEEDRDDLTDEARRRRAEADELRSKPDERSYYSPDETSFFAPTSEDRADQARRAASRVRRRAAEVRSETPEPTFQSSDDIISRALDAEQKPAALSSTDNAPVTEEKKPSQAGGSILDRAVGLAGATRQAVEPPKPEALESKKVGSSGGSIMDRAVQRPSTPTAKPEPEEPLKAKVGNRPPISESLMDRAMKRPVTTPKPQEPHGPFEPKTVLSAAAKPSPTRKVKVSRSGSKTEPLKSSLVQSASNRVDAAAAKTNVQAPVSERLKRLAESKSPARSPEKLVTEVAPAPQSLRKKPSEKPAVAAPSVKAPEVKSAPVAAPISLQSDVAANPPVAAETIYADQAVVTPTSGIRTAKTKAFAAFEWMIASRYLRARKKEGFVSVITGFSLVGIALGVATLIVVMAVMTGFRDTLVTQIIGGSPHINVYSQSDKFENYDALADQIRVVDGITNVTPVVQGQVLGTGNQRHTGVIVRGMRKSDLERLIANAEPEVLNGTLDNFVEDKGVALGAELAAKLGLRVGDFITLISPDGDITPFQATPLPRVKDYKIIQTFKLGVQEIDYGVAFMPFAEAQIYFNKQNQADALDVFVDDPQSVSDSLRNIELGSYEDDIFQSARTSISVNNWKNLNGRLIGAINLERQVMFVILTMIILVAALNIISGLVMLVKDKARDIAIMRTMGMARGSVLRIFFICGASIGVVGSVAGVILGVVFVWNIHAIQGGVEWITGTQVWDPGVRAGIEKIPTKLQFSDVALTLFIALGLSFFATLFPAWKAAKLDPVEALRYE